MQPGSTKIPSRAPRAAFAACFVAVSFTASPVMSAADDNDGDKGRDCGSFDLAAGCQF